MLCDDCVSECVCEVWCLNMYGFVGHEQKKFYVKVKLTENWWNVI